MASSKEATPDVGNLCLFACKGCDLQVDTWFQLFSHSCSLKVAKEKR